MNKIQIFKRLLQTPFWSLFTVLMILLSSSLIAGFLAFEEYEQLNQEPEEVSSGGVDGLDSKQHYDSLQQELEQLTPDNTNQKLLYFKKSAGELQAYLLQPDKPARSYVAKIDREGNFLPNQSLPASTFSQSEILAYLPRNGNLVLNWSNSNYSSEPFAVTLGIKDWDDYLEFRKQIWNDKLVDFFPKLVLGYMNHKEWEHLCFEISVPHEAGKKLALNKPQFAHEQWKRDFEEEQRIANTRFKFVKVGDSLQIIINDQLDAALSKLVNEALTPNSEISEGEFARFSEPLENLFKALKRKDRSVKSWSSDRHATEKYISFLDLDVPYRDWESLVNKSKNENLFTLVLRAIDLQISASNMVAFEVSISEDGALTSMKSQRNGSIGMFFLAITTMCLAIAGFGTILWVLWKQPSDKEKDKAGQLTNGGTSEIAFEPVITPEIVDENVDLQENPPIPAKDVPISAFFKNPEGGFYQFAGEELGEPFYMIPKLPEALENDLFTLIIDGEEVQIQQYQDSRYFQVQLGKSLPENKKSTDGSVSDPYLLIKNIGADPRKAFKDLDFDVDELLAFLTERDVATSPQDLKDAVLFREQLLNCKEMDDISAFSKAFLSTQDEDQMRVADWLKEGMNKNWTKVTSHCKKGEITQALDHIKTTLPNDKKTTVDKYQKHARIGKQFVKTKKEEDIDDFESLIGEEFKGQNNQAHALYQDMAKHYKDDKWKLLQQKTKLEHFLNYLGEELENETIKEGLKSLQKTGKILEEWNRQAFKKVVPELETLLPKHSQEIAKWSVERSHWKSLAKYDELAPIFHYLSKHLEVKYQDKIDVLLDIGEEKWVKAKQFRENGIQLVKGVDEARLSGDLLRVYDCVNDFTEKVAKKRLIETDLLKEQLATIESKKDLKDKLKAYELFYNALRDVKTDNTQTYFDQQRALAEDKEKLFKGLRKYFRVMYEHKVLGHMRRLKEGGESDDLWYRDVVLFAQHFIDISRYVAEGFKLKHANENIKSAIANRPIDWNSVKVFKKGDSGEATSVLIKLGAHYTGELDFLVHDYNANAEFSEMTRKMRS